jgi:hypothetical protein
MANCSIQAAGNGFAARRRDDGRIRRALGVAHHAIPKEQVHIGQPQSPQVLPGFVVQAAQPLDAVDLRSQSG